MKNYLGIDIGGTHVKYGLVDSLGQVSNVGKTMTPQTQKGLIDLIEKQVDSYSSFGLFGVGLSIPGIIKDSKMITSGALTFLDTQTFMSDVTAKISIPVSFVNDANAVALAEKWCGNAQCYSDFICITLGTAVGGSLFLNNSLYEGAKGLAGEFGMSYEIGRKNPTLLDTIAAKCGVVAGACREYSNKSEYPTRDFEEIIHRSQQGEELAQKTIDKFCKNNAELLYNLAVTIGPEALLIGGSVSSNAEIMNKIFNMYHLIAEEADVFPQDLLPEVQVCKFKANSGVLGSVYKFERKNYEK